MRRFKNLVDGQALIRPWLQAIPYRVSNYDGHYVTRQISATEAAGGAGWSLWNPAGRYDEVCAALTAAAAADDEFKATSLFPLLIGTLATQSTDFYWPR